MADRTVLLCAGGTGGHLFPAEALAHELKRRGWTVHLVTDGRATRFAGGFPADGVHTVSSATLAGRNPLKFLGAFVALWRGFREASALISRLRPTLVVGFGGYPTLPPLFAATRRGVPTLIHEQNAVMGRANKALAPRVTAIAGGFLAGGPGRFGDKIFHTGNPVRPAVVEAASVPYGAAGPGNRFNLLVFGGSQGAQFFSQAVPPAIAGLSEGERARLKVTQQARSEDEAAVRDAYADIGVEAEISPFFDDMAARIAAAHLVICRAGASTVSEIAVIGRPALLVPYPHALDHDQAANAASLADRGGAELHQQSTLSVDTFGRLIRQAMQEPERLSRMAAAAREAGRPDATLLLADLAEAISSGRSVQEFAKGSRP